MKGLIEFIEAAKILKERNVIVKFLIVGESPTNFDSFFGKFSKKIGLVKDIKEEIEQFIIELNLWILFQPPSTFRIVKISEISPEFKFDLSQPIEYSESS